MTTREGSSQSATAGLDYMLDCAFWQAGAPSFKDEAGLKSEPTLLLVAGTHAGAVEIIAVCAGDSQPSSLAKLNTGANMIIITYPCPPLGFAAEVNKTNLLLNTGANVKGIARRCARASGQTMRASEYSFYSF